jgi:hypothetical protein
MQYQTTLALVVALATMSSAAPAAAKTINLGSETFGSPQCVPDAQSPVTVANCQSAASQAFASICSSGTCSITGVADAGLTGPSVTVGDCVVDISVGTDFTTNTITFTEAPVQAAFTNLLNTCANTEKTSALDSAPQISSMDGNILIVFDKHG